MTHCAVITGSSRGIGQATAAVFRSAGWRVIGMDRIHSDSGVDKFYEVDLESPTAIQEVCKEIASQESAIHALVNNAALQSNSLIKDLDVGEWDRIMAVNLRAPFLLIQQLRHLLMAARASVVNISSVHAHHTSESIAAYASAKGGLVALSRAAALELAGDGIRVNAICPGAIDTEMLREGFQRGQHGSDGEVAMQSLRSKHPLGRIGLPREVGEMALFLASPEKSGFTTGQSFTLDGGATARLSTE